MQTIYVFAFHLKAIYVLYFLFCINRNLTDLNCRSFNLYFFVGMELIIVIRVISGLHVE